MLKIENLCKSFRTEDVETIALNNVSFTVEDGEFVAIMGPSGCGKSTLLNILGLLDNPTSGKYFLGNHEVANLKENERTDVRKGEIGFVFQSFNLIDELTVEENIELPLTYLNIPKAERKAKVEAIMKRMAISHRAKHFPHQLSGGQQQRVAIARAMVFGPKLILADEPTGNLDSKNGKNGYAELKGTDEVKSKGNENEFCILLSDKAKSLALPMLLCTEDDVEGNHSTASGKVDNKDLFYIMSRGLSYKEAIRLIVKAKFNQIIQNNVESMQKDVNNLKTQMGNIDAILDDINGESL